MANVDDDGGDDDAKFGWLAPAMSFRSEPTRRCLFLLLDHLRWHRIWLPSLITTAAGIYQGDGARACRLCLCSIHPLNNTTSLVCSPSHVRVDSALSYFSSGKEIRSPNRRPRRISSSQTQKNKVDSLAGTTKGLRLSWPSEWKHFVLINRSYFKWPPLDLHCWIQDNRSTVVTEKLSVEDGASVAMWVGIANCHLWLVVICHRLLLFR